MAEPEGIQTGIPSLRKRRLLTASHVLVQIIAVIAIVAMVNWLAARHYHRFDWTRSSYYELSEKTKQVLASLKAPLSIIVFIPPSGGEREYIEKTLQDVRYLLDEYEFCAKDKVRIEYVDPDRDLARARQLVETYKIDSPDVVIFASGENHKHVRLDDMVEVEQANYMAPPRVRAFKGEGVFLSAIQTVTEERAPKVYFLTGHGERDPDEASAEDGYAVFARLLKQDHLTAEKWNYQSKQSWPTDAAAIVIAGPRAPFAEPEITALENYLQNKGRLLVLLDPRVRTGLEPLLERWEVTVGDDLVVMPVLGAINVTAFGEEYATHPVTEKLTGLNTTFPYARSVRRKPGGAPPAGSQQPLVTELVRTPEVFWAETDYAGARYQFDAAKDVAGPVSLAVAVETRKPGGVDIDVTRMVVVGCAGFLDNAHLRDSVGNTDLAMNAVNWLLAREQLIAVSPKVPEEFSLDMTVGQARAVYALAIGGLPLAAGLVGLLVWIRRRK